MPEEQIDEVPANSRDESSTEDPVADPVIEESLPSENEQVVEPGISEETELDRLRKVNENYKRELEGFRKPNVSRLQKQILPSDKNITPAESDYISKSADIMDELEGEFQRLSPANFKRIEPLILPAMRATYEESVKKGVYVARGKLKAVVSELIAFAQPPRVVKTGEEMALENSQLDQAEISAVRSSKGGVASVVPTEKDKIIAEEAGTPVAIITANRLAAEKRQADFQKTVKHV